MVNQTPKSAIVQRGTLLILLLILTGCSAGPGLPGFLILVFLLSFAACRPTLDEDRMEEFFLRFLYNNRENSSSSGSSCGSTLDYTRSFDLSTLDLAGAGIGFKITGHNAGDDFGTSISSAGDFNGDGFGDIVISAPNYNSNTGRVYVIFGQSTSSGTISDIDLSALTTGQGIFIDGTATTDRLGRYDSSISGGGDFNGDGFGDILIGSRNYNTEGGSWMIFGNASPTNISLSGLTVSEGVLFQYGGNFYTTGQSTSNLGDINGDGIDDLAISSRYNASANEGLPLIVYGKTSGWTATISMNSVGTAAGFYVDGDSTNARLSNDGFEGVGDVNQDGINDFLVSRTGTGTDVGGAYVIYGASGTRANLDTASLAATDGYRLTGTNASDRWGLSLAAGDFNGDSQPDFAVGTHFYNANNGQAAVFLSDVGALTIGSHSAAQGFTLEGSSAEYSSNQLAMSGDVNGDGKDDLLMGARQADNSGTDSGSAYLIFGQSGIASTGATLASYTGGTSGIRIDGPAASSRLGFDVALADINGDSCADMLIGAVNASGADYTYVIYGGSAQ